MSRAKGFLITAVTSVFTWIVFYQIGLWYQSDAPVWKASILIASVIIHEIFHMIFMEKNGIKAHMFVLVVIGGAYPDKKDRDKMKLLPWSRRAGIVLAGVVGNVVFVAAAAFAYWAGQISQTQLSQIANLNGSLILYNMIPFWILDGGQFAKILFNSSPESQDRKYVATISMAFLVVIGLLNLCTRQDFIGTTWIVFFCLHYQARNDDPFGSRNRLAMNETQRFQWSLLYIALLGIGATLLATTKPWINP